MGEEYERRTWEKNMGEEQRKGEERVTDTPPPLSDRM
jgi:hypothetical protein